MMRTLRLAAFTCVLAGSAAAKFDFGPWQPGTSPEEIGRRIAAHFIESRHPDFGRPTRPERISYPEVCTWYGALNFAKLTHDEKLKAELIKRFEPLLGPTKWPEHKDADANGMLDERDLVPVPDHVDHTVFAAVPFELYIQTHDARYLKLGEAMADWQWTSDPVFKWPFYHPVFAKHFPNRVGPDAQKWIDQGYSWQTRMWIDDMFMITMAQAQAFRATGDKKYVERAAKEMVLYLDTLQEPNGLFYHAPGVPYFWGRGDGWMAAGMAELLRSIPSDNANRERIMKGYKLMMASLLKYQDEKGMWHQLIDDPQAWPETSCTGMFTAAFITGVKEGWLDEATYGPAAKKAWLAVITYLDQNDDIREVCQGTNKYDPKSDDPDMKTDGRSYYLARKRITGDMHGQAPLLWCASALLR